MQVSTASNRETLSFASNGFIDVVAIGSIFANNVSHTTQNANNTITFNAVGDASDIGVGILSSGGAADIRLIAGDDVNHIVPALTPDPVFPDDPTDVPTDTAPPVVLPTVAAANQLGNLPSTGPFSISTAGSTTDPEVTLFNSAGDALFNNNAVGVPLVLTSLPEDTYFIAISGFDSTVGPNFQVTGGTNTGPFNLALNDDITANGTLAVGEVIFFSFTVQRILMTQRILMIQAMVILSPEILMGLVLLPTQIRQA